MERNVYISLWAMELKEIKKFNRKKLNTNVSETLFIL